MSVQLREKDHALGATRHSSAAGEHENVSDSRVEGDGDEVYMSCIGIAYSRNLRIALQTAT